MELYDTEAKEHTLSARRSEGHWRRSLSKKDIDAAVYERNGDIEGYILYKLSGWQDRDPRRTLSVEEIVAATRRAREALLSFMAGLDPLVYGIKLFTPRGEPLHPYLKSSHVDAKIDPDQMLRLVDVEEALGTSGSRQRRRSSSTYQTTSYRRTPASTPSQQARSFVGQKRGRASRSTYASSPSSTPGTFRPEILPGMGSSRRALPKL